MKRNAVAWAALIVSTAALVSSRGLTRPLPAAPRVPAESQKAAHALSEAFGAVAEFVKPSVVQISVEKRAGANALRGGRRMPFPAPNSPEAKDFEEMLRKFFGPDARPEREQLPGPRGSEGVGSGFFYDGVEMPAKVVGRDPQSDVAVIRVEKADYRPLPKGVSSKLKVGELVMAVGSPYNLSQSVTTGIISATDRNDVHINEYESFLQTDAAINPGNSGGPLVNMDGQVIGVNSAIVTGGRGNDGVGFAIPIDMASTVADNLIKNGKMSRSRVGIVLEPLAPAMAKQFGLDAKTKGILVADVLKGSPADKAGLKAGDVILKFNGNPVGSLPAFRMTVASSEAGHEFQLTYWREGKEHTTAIVPAPADSVKFAQELNRNGSREDDEPEAKKSDAPKAQIDDFGLEVQAVTPELAAQFGHPKDARGLLVSNVKDGSPAEAAGIETGQLISRVVHDRKVQAVTSVKEFQALAGKSDDLALYVEAPGRPGIFVTLSKSK
jgi:serine protease Do